MTQWPFYISRRSFLAPSFMSCALYWSFPHRDEVLRAVWVPEGVMQLDFEGLSADMGAELRHALILESEVLARLGWIDRHRLRKTSQNGASVLVGETIFRESRVNEGRLLAGGPTLTLNAARPTGACCWSRALPAEGCSRRFWGSARPTTAGELTGTGLALFVAQRMPDFATRMTSCTELVWSFALLLSSVRLNARRRKGDDYALLSTESVFDPHEG